MDEKGELKVSKFHYQFVDDFYQDTIGREHSTLKQWRKISSNLKDYKKIKRYQLPRKFNGVLRDYQYEGYRWLFFMHENNINGCLADDMGLGKTVQTLAFLLKLKQERKLGVSLVVVPVNTLANWETEIKRFTPDLKYHLYYGRDREMENILGYDFILSSYHTLRNDIEIFKDIALNYMILDESQSIKNSNSLLFKTMRILRSSHRISLTGTPIENSTFELWSQMEFLNPGILGKRIEFSKKFAVPIEKHGDTGAAEKLRKIIYPFILRRKKEDVAGELPDISEITLYSRMGDEQSSIYEEHRTFYRDAVMGKIDKNGLENSAIEIFSALLKLRQTALFPVLADSKFKNIQSCKFMQLQDMVEEILRENHKIVIFSQFVKCLEIIKEYFHKKKLQYSYIDGSVDAGRRKIEIDKFQENEDHRIFILSLKAGGVGINLTSADYVILFEPWWNPAVENQAIDRLYRIGQSRKVIAYKMVVKNTVEEKMLELQERKKKLVGQLITTESSFFKSLEKEDIARLFEAV
jgi:non-specific serine/threonine protein kinase